MSWIQRIELLDRFSNFFLIDDELIFGNSVGYHEEYLQKRFNLSPFFAQLFRMIFPRGAASYDTYNNNQMLIEMSSELKPYIPQLVDRWHVSPQDRPTWDFNDSLYKVDKEHVKNKVLEYMDYEDLDESTLKFIQQYLPELYQKLNRTSEVE